MAQQYNLPSALSTECPLHLLFDLSDGVGSRRQKRVFIASTLVHLESKVFLPQLPGLFNPKVYSLPRGGPDNRPDS